jgi:ABC-type Fe3+/spermidine/putrescine transport system ATPase subunit
MCLLGPSGCGKTTLLRIIAGLEQPDQGQILLEGEDITPQPSHRRDFGLMFQDYALFPHMTVGGNIGFGLKMRGWPQPKISARVQELLSLVEMAGYAERPVYELSGGQQQRVALARSLAPNPRLLMLDEPLGALDRTLRDQLLIDLQAILKQLGQTAVYVTHDQLEAFAVADRVALMREGRIEQLGTPEEIYLYPASPFAARFLGMSNILSGEIASLTPPLIHTAIGRLPVQDLPAGLYPGDRAQLVIRPEGASVSRADRAGSNQIVLTLVNRSFRGAHTLIQLVGLDGKTRLAFEIPGMGCVARAGDRVNVSIEPSAVIVFENR